MFKKFLIIVAGLLVLGVIVSRSDRRDNEQAESRSDGAPRAARTGMPSAGEFYASQAGLVKPTVTMAKFSSLKDGMSYQEAVAIIGQEGTEMSSSTMPAIKGVQDAIVTKMYSWTNGDGSNMNAMFQNDKMISKAQFGLD